MLDLVVIVSILTALGKLIEVYVPHKYIALINLGLGVLAGGFYINAGTLSENILVGIVAGLSASGFMNLADIPLDKIKKK
ncbi:MULTISPECIES: hypothetical protein [Bacillus cereus group]|uniref:hypothetical protein n=1 Tax=Bacillus cereus group TaxID=86661 RepID=UPI001F5A4FD9